MKHLKLVILIAAMMTSSTIYASAAPITSCVVNLQKAPASSGPNDIEDYEYGHRRPTQPVECNISSDGIQFTSVTESPDILTYELWDAEGTCSIASFCDEAGFINFLFSQSGEFQIRFTTPDYNLVGFIQI